MTHRLLALAVVFVLAPCLQAGAGEYRIGKLEIDHAWARATPGMARTGAAYIVISNHGDTMDRLVAISTPLARKAELHTHVMESNIMKMRRLPAMEVHPGKQALMRPGATHVMLMGLKAPLKEGDRFPLALTFERAGTLNIQVHVYKIGAMGPGGDGHSGHHQGQSGHKHGN